MAGNALVKHMSWIATMTDSSERHVRPLGDLRPHDESHQCWCKPTDDEGVWVHHSLDRREFIERRETKVS